MPCRAWMQAGFALKALIATGFRKLFSVKYFQAKYFGLYQKVFLPIGLFDGVSKRVRYRHGLTLHLHLGDWIQQNLYFLGAYEAREIAFLERYLKPGDVVFDVGANIGLHTLVAAKMVGPKGKVYAFEPFRQNFEHLQAHIQLNGLTNVVAAELAVSDTDGPLDFFAPPPNNSGMGSRYSQAVGSRPQVVQAVALDRYAADLPALNLVKIDIEGGELLALRGMRNLLATHKPKVVMEIDRSILQNAQLSDNEIVGFMAALGYHMQFITPSGHLSKAALADSSTNFVFVHEQDLVA
ncbi:FkbM family methyltransferase [Hymenobacter jejuensis]|uniref:FkbM family methyltransferase n=1 Tax=Hymenobacter jejuensis TaxID=2502781 RepID=A0A5B8A4R1_9BACT|nr:FkbM family methyltransferase [Hymenobacter jejuensis]QDA62300.1 FkbM family methyltransferase [Hymenobacter jejuensis]